MNDRETTLNIKYNIREKAVLIPYKFDNDELLVLRTASTPKEFAQLIVIRCGMQSTVNQNSITYLNGVWLVVCAIQIKIATNTINDP